MFVLVPMFRVYGFDYFADFYQIKLH